MSEKIWKQMLPCRFHETGSRWFNLKVCWEGAQVTLLLEMISVMRIRHGRVRQLGFLYLKSFTAPCE